MSLDDLVLAPSPDGALAAEAPRREFLTCTLAGETYGVDILQVQEIREIDHVTRVPHVAPYVRGVVNLRGAIVPIVDLGLMFGFPEPLPLEKASAIVLNVDRRMVGLVVASVSDVVALAESEILPPPTAPSWSRSGSATTRSGACSDAASPPRSTWGASSFRRATSRSRCTTRGSSPRGTARSSARSS